MILSLASCDSVLPVMCITIYVCNKEIMTKPYAFCHDSCAVNYFRLYGNTYNVSYFCYDKKNINTANSKLVKYNW